MIFVCFYTAARKRGILPTDEWNIWGVFWHPNLYESFVFTIEMCFFFKAAEYFLRLEVHLTNFFFSIFLCTRKTGNNNSFTFFFFPDVSHENGCRTQHHSRTIRDFRSFCYLGLFCLRSYSLPQKCNNFIHNWMQTHTHTQLGAIF